MKLFSVFSFLFIFVFFNSLTAQTPNRDFNRTSNYDVQNYIIRVSFDSKHKKVFGDTTVQLKPAAADFNSFELDAYDLVYDSVKLEPNGESLRFAAENGKIKIFLEKNYSPDDLISVRFKYSTSPAKGIYFVDAGNDGGASLHPAQIWSQGEAEEARYWIPSFDFPSDKAASEEYITVQKGEIAVGNGELIEKMVNADGTATFHYKMTIPHSTYLISFVVGKYSLVSDVYKNIPLGFYVYPGEEVFARKAYGKTKEMMRIYEELTGVNFPYNKYDQTMVANFKFGGMENITATTMADTDIRLANFSFGKRIAENLVSHELSHSWFGDLVTTKNWANLWLNEGFATFMEAAYREKMYGRADYLRSLQEDFEEFQADDAVNQHRHALYNQIADANSEDLFDITIYKKGGLVVHTLREQIGDAAFWKAINIYLNRFKFKNVEYKDLQAVMEETSGQKLDWFFAQWVVGAGYPKLDVRQIYNPVNRTLRLNINQIQPNDGITPAEFILPLEAAIKTAKGTQTEKLDIKKRGEVLTIQLKDKPTGVIFDKDFKIPLKEIKLHSLEIEK